MTKKRPNFHPSLPSSRLDSFSSGRGSIEDYSLQFSELKQKVFREESHLVRGGRKYEGSREREANIAKVLPLPITFGSKMVY